MAVFDGSGDAVPNSRDDNSGAGLNARLEGFRPVAGGTYHIQVDDPGGIGTYTVSVALISEIVDEHADGPETTGTVTVGGFATGRLDYDGDRDWFAVTLMAGGTYRIDVKGETRADYGGTLHNPSLAVFDGSGDAVPNSRDDNSGAGLNARLEGFRPVAGGTYHIQVDDPGGIGTYTVSVSEIVDEHADGPETTGTVTVGGTATGRLDYDGDRDWFAVTLMAGGTYRIDVKGETRADYGGTLHNPALAVFDGSGDAVPNSRDDNSGAGLNARLEGFRPVAGGTYHIQVDDPGGIGTYTVSVALISEIVDEHADGPETTGTVTVGGFATGRLDYDGDRDWFAVTLMAGGTYRIDVKGETRADYGGTLHNPSLAVFDGSGDAVPNSRDDNSGAGLNARLEGFRPVAGGTYHIQVDDPGGIGTYTVSVSEIVDEHADGPETTGTVTVGGTATGRLDYDGDRDWFAVTLMAGGTYRIDVKGETRADYGGTLHNPALAVFDGSGDAVPNSRDDNSGAGLNARLEGFRPVAGGTYHIQVDDPGGIGTYTVSVSEIVDEHADGPETTGTVTVGGTATGRLDYDGDRDWFAVTLMAGGTYRIDVKGETRADYGGTLHNPSLAVFDGSGDAVPNSRDDNSGAGLNARLEGFRPVAGGTYHIQVDDPGGIGTYTVSVSEIVDEHADGPETTGTVTVGGTATGRLDYDGDRDWFAVTLMAGGTYRIDVKGETRADYGGTLHNPSLAVFDGSGDAVPNSRDDNSGAGLNARLEGFRPVAGGTYYIEVDDPGGIGTYTVSVSGPPARLFDSEVSYRILTFYGRDTEIALSDYLADGVTGVTFSLISCDGSWTDYHNSVTVENGNLLLTSNTLGHINGANTQTETVCTVTGAGSSVTQDQEFMLYTVSDRKPQPLVAGALSLVAARADALDVQVAVPEGPQYVRISWRKAGDSSIHSRVVFGVTSETVLTIPGLDAGTDYDIRVALMTRQSFDLYREGNTGADGTLITEGSPAAKWKRNLSAGGLGNSATLSVSTSS